MRARSVYDFRDLILVECTACGRMAMQTAESEDDGKSGLRKYRTTCTACHRTAVRSMSRADDALWLAAETRHGRLYARNFEHLDHIEAYVRASLRKVTFEPGGLRNSAVTSRLPAWVKSAKNRAEILKAIERMRRK